MQSNELERQKLWKRAESLCPVSKTLDIIGDKWSMLIIRDLLAGKRYYNEFLSSYEGISTNILAARLKAFVEHGLVERVVDSSGQGQGRAGKNAYELTNKGKDLYPVLHAIAFWGLEHIEGTAMLVDAERFTINQVDK